MPNFFAARFHHTTFSFLGKETENKDTLGKKRCQELLNPGHLLNELLG